MMQQHDLESTAMASILGLREKHGLNGHVKVIEISLGQVNHPQQAPEILFIKRNQL